MKTLLPPLARPSSVLFLAAGLAALFLSSAARAEDTRVILSMEVTPAGKNIPAPTPGHPVYYLPVFAGYKELGPVLDFYERKPAAEGAIRQALVNSLARQGYLPATATFPPSLVLTFQWGTIALLKAPRQYNSVGFPAAYGSSLLGSEYNAGNADQVHFYVVGDSWKDVSRIGPNAREILQLVPRHFLMISAKTVATATHEKEVLLWRAHASMNVWDHYLDEVMGTLITTATPLVGQSLQPMIISAPIVSAGFLLASNPPGENSAAAPLVSKQP
jgi:hypothetical protein